MESWGLGKEADWKGLKKKKKKDIWSLSGLKVHSLLASPETTGEKTWVNVRETLGVNHSGYRRKQEGILKIVPSLSKLKPFARSRMGELISLTPLPSAAGAPRWNPGTSWNESSLCKIRRIEGTEEQPSGEFGTELSRNSTFVSEAPRPPPSSLPSTEVTEKKSDRQSCHWRSCHPHAPLLCHPAASVALGGAREGCQGIRLYVHFHSIFSALYAKEVLLQPHFLLRSLPPRSTPRLSTNPANCFTPYGRPHGWCY